MPLHILIASAWLTIAPPATGDQASTEPEAEASTDEAALEQPTFEALKIDAGKDYLFGSCRRAYRKAKSAPADRKDALQQRAVRICHRNRLWEEQGKRIEAETHTFRGGLAAARKARCQTAICWGPSYRWGFEPLVEVPIAKSFAVPGSGLGKFINSNGIEVRVDAGFRFWWAWDWVSIAMYLSTPMFNGSKETIQIPASSFAYPVSQIRRPLPGVALGLFADLLWIGFDYNQLRNGSSENTRDPGFPANEIVSHAFSFTIAIAPVAGLRNGIGTLLEANRRKKEAAEKEKEAEEKLKTAEAAEKKAAEKLAEAEAKEEALDDASPDVATPPPPAPVEETPTPPVPDDAGGDDG